jgi:hypothetical protein
VGIGSESGHVRSSVRNSRELAPEARELREFTANVGQQLVAVRVAVGD